MEQLTFRFSMVDISASDLRGNTTSTIRCSMGGVNGQQDVTAFECRQNPGLRSTPWSPGATTRAGPGFFLILTGPPDSEAITL
jgi:hypothetical protein